MGMKGPWLVACSVNPQMGLEHKVQRLEEPVKRQKKVAVVGGGPVGMRAAIYCAQRGHQVELFEKSDHLGGQTVYADAMSFKWPIRDHRNWVIAQLKKSAVKVTLNHAPTAEELEGEHFDVIIAATGAYPNIPNIPGLVDEKGQLAPHVHTNDQVWAEPEKLGNRIVLIGASESGIETAIHLASKGKEVYALTRRNEIAEDAPRPHGITMTWINKNYGNDPRFSCRPEWEKYDSLHGVINATTVEVGDGYVKYVDGQGAEQTIPCDEVVISGGVCKNIQPALALSKAAPDFYMIGDCSDHGGDLRKGYRQAWAVASTI
jgi:NADPH-dependent glutamate synthase beta subunit-like oxidoreductase